VADSFTGEVVDERWQVGELLGAGGMGSVYRAERLKLKKPVAIKFLDTRSVRAKEAVARFDREARAISRLQHPHCVSIIDFGVHRGRPYIVIDFVNGRLLTDEMGKETLTLTRAVAITRQILDALQHAHMNGVIHRDLKPDNIMLTHVGGDADFVKILDFGLARIVAVNEPSISLPATVAGTPSYMSPEQASGKKVDHRTDLYSAAVILYGMVTGRKPFRADDPGEIMRMQREVSAPRPRDVAPDRGISESLELVILRGLAKSPDVRYSSAAEFSAALLGTREGRTLARSSGRGRSFVGAMLTAGLLLAAGAGGSSVYHYYRSHEAVHPAPKVVEPPAAPPAPKVVEPAPKVVEPAPKVVEPAPKVVEPPPAPKIAEPEPVPAPPPEPAPAPTPPAPRADPRRADVEKLLSADKNDAAEKQLLAIIKSDPQAAWPRLLLGEVYFRRLWRTDCIETWEEALKLDPSLAHDPLLHNRLCHALGSKWHGTGLRLLHKLDDTTCPPT
jgi:serine/threonine-protein kinase